MLLGLKRSLNYPWLRSLCLAIHMHSSKNSKCRNDNCDKKRGWE